MPFLRPWDMPPFAWMNGFPITADAPRSEGCASWAGSARPVISLRTPPGQLGTAAERVHLPLTPCAWHQAHR